MLGPLDRSQCFLSTLLADEDYGPQRLVFRIVRIRQCFERLLGPVVGKQERGLQPAIICRGRSSKQLEPFGGKAAASGECSAQAPATSLARQASGLIREPRRALHVPALQLPRAL